MTFNVDLLSLSLSLSLDPPRLALEMSLAYLFPLLFVCLSVGFVTRRRSHLGTSEEEKVGENSCEFSPVNNSPAPGMSQKQKVGFLHVDVRGGVYLFGYCILCPTSPPLWLHGLESRGIENKETFLFCIILIFSSPHALSPVQQGKEGNKRSFVSF